MSSCSFQAKVSPTTISDEQMSGKTNFTDFITLLLHEVHVKLYVIDTGDTTISKNDPVRYAKDTNATCFKKLKSDKTSNCLVPRQKAIFENIQGDLQRTNLNIFYKIVQKTKT